MTPDEAAVLGALITGALSLRDVADVERGHLAAPGTWRALCTLASLLALRAAGDRRVRGRTGLDVAQACRACEAAGVFVGAAYEDSTGRRHVLGSLPDAAREAPRRRDALAALRRLDAARAHRHDLAGERSTFVAALGDLVEDVALSYRRRAAEDGGLLCAGMSAKVRSADGPTYEPRWYVRPIEPDAMPSGPALLRALAAELRARADRASPEVGATF